MQYLVIGLKSMCISRAVVLFVVQPEERNVFDQARLADALFEKHGVKSIRRTLLEIKNEAKLGIDDSLVM